MLKFNSERQTNVQISLLRMWELCQCLCLYDDDIMNATAIHEIYHSLLNMYKYLQPNYIVSVSKEKLRKGQCGLTQKKNPLGSFT